MTVRFFGGFDFDPKDAQTLDPAVASYTKGVPMGGTPLISANEMNTSSTCRKPNSRVTSSG
jgi:hypothetical protein